MRNQMLALVLATSGLVGSVSATPVTSSEPTLIEQAVSAAMAEVMKTGPHEIDWNKSGIDINSIVAAKRGGPAANYVLATDKDGERSIAVYAPTSVAGLIPRQWNLLSQIGELETGVSGGPVVIEELDEGFALVVRASERRNGTAICDDKFGGAQLYATAKVGEAEMPAEVAEMIFKAGIESIRDKHICARYTQNGAAFTVRYFMEDGRSLPHMNDYREVITIIPAGPIADLLSSQ